MQTFLPYSDFEATAKVLDDRRLGKQRVEAYQILKVLRGESRGWQKHPCVKMWKGYETALTVYMNTMIREWIKRGFKNTMKIAQVPDDYTKPTWLGMEEFHLSHRCNLARKSDRYKTFWPDADPAAPYIWPGENHG